MLLKLLHVESPVVQGIELSDKIFSVIITDWCYSQSH